MADTLDQLLEPGERVVYRAPRRWEPNEWFVEGSVYVLSIALASLTGLISFDWAGAACVGAAFFGVWAFTLHCYLRDSSREALVTERRLLHRGGWVTPKLSEVKAGGLRKVEACKDRLRITGEDGRRIGLGHPHQAWGCGVALAQVAGLPPPRLETKGELAADYLWMVCASTLGLAAALLPLTWLYGAYMDGTISLGPVVELIPITSLYGDHMGGTHPLELPVFIALFMFVGWFAHAIGMEFAGPITVVLLRPYLSHRELIDWIDHSTVFWAPTSDPDGTVRFAARLKQLAAVLYGKPLPPASQGGGSHGG